MSFETGGRADKLGNRYEGRWVAKQLLRLLNEEIVSVIIEAIGDDEYGVDLWIIQKNGARQAQQCKSRNKSKEAWSISDFKTRDILNRFRYQLDRSSQIEFKFVSGVPFSNLADICDSARNSNQDSENFYMHQIVGASRENIFRQFCEGMGLYHTVSDDRNKAFNYLRRLRVDCYSDDETAWIDLKAQAGFLITGAPETIISTLLSYAENSDSLGKPIYADELWAYLKDQEMFPRKLAYDQRIMPCIERLQEEFKNSIQPGLVSGVLIPREEATECVQLLQNEKGLIILHGPAGLGKSGVLFEVVKKLKKNRTPYLPLRLDRRIPEKNATQYGIDVGLPDSPVNCLIAVAGRRSCVLILDQLDAIRWTSVHSANSLDVCREIINQVLAFRREGKKISVIVACRTFDLKHDPELKQWGENKNIYEKWEQIEVRPLSSIAVQQITGEQYATLKGRQTSILASPQNLAMWVHLQQEGRIGAFKSNIELMKMFWDSKRTTLARVANIDNINGVINTLTLWMEANGKISAPVLILSHYSPHTLYAIKSNGIIQEQNRIISFCHQSYLDYLIAEKLILEIFAGGSILQWLGAEEKQTLFRREQFRQALSWLADEAPEYFSNVVQEVLSSRDIRFHMKHLVLEVIGQFDDLADYNQLTEYMLELYKDGYWHNHILTTTFHGSRAWVIVLIEKNEIAAALRSAEINKIQEALNLLSSVLHKMNDQVVQILRPWIDINEDWSKRILDTIGWEVAKDSDAIFEMRLKLAQTGIVSDFIDWKELCGKHAIRAFRLFSIVLSIISNNSDTNNYSHQRSRIEQFYDHDIEALREAAAACPLQAWDLLMPIVERLTSQLSEEEYDPSVLRWQKDNLNGGQTSLERVAVDSLIAAGQVLAKNTSLLLLERTKIIEENASSILQNILIEIYSCLPSPCANDGIGWLVKDIKRFRLGNDYNEPEWMSAFRLIEALSPYCSQELFEQLENKLVHYHDPDELFLAKHHLDIWREYGGWSDYWGRTQYFLLPALCKNRCKKSTLELVGVLKRKFEGYSTERFLRSGKIKGGWVGSSLNKDLHRIRELSWLKIIKNKTVPIEGKANWKQYFDDHIIETSVSQFARSLQYIAESYPERFGQLALRFPIDTDYRYIAAIISSLALTKPNDRVLAEAKIEWEPASISTITKVLQRFNHYIYNEIALEVCRLVEARAEEIWPEFVLDAVAYLATHDLESDRGYEKGDTAHDLLTATLNCVRGVACNAIADLLWNHSDLFSRFRLTIQSNINEKDPVVLIATTRILTPILNIDKSQAVDWFIAAALRDIRVSASHYGSHFIGYMIKEFPDDLMPVIQKMMNDHNQESATLGAHMVSSFNLFYGFFAEEVNHCMTGRASQRAGIAKTAAANIGEQKYAETCQVYIAMLMNDPDKEVRSIINRMFKAKIFDIPENVIFTENYVNSKSFADGAYGLFSCLEHYKESLVPFSKIILNACRAIVKNYGSEPDKSIPRINRSTHGLSPLLLRLYEQAQERNPEIANLCLNVWDVLYENRIGDIRDLTTKISQ